MSDLMSYVVFNLKVRCRAWFLLFFQLVVLWISEQTLFSDFIPEDLRNFLIGGFKTPCVQNSPKSDMVVERQTLWAIHFSIWALGVELDDLYDQLVALWNSKQTLFWNLVPEGLEFLSLGRKHGLETPSDRSSVKVYMVLEYEPLWAIWSSIWAL